MRIILPKEEITDKKITIIGKKAKYLISVLRCKAGDELQILDGEGNIYKSRISEVDNKKVTAEIIEKTSSSSESPLNLILIQSILKGEKMDFVIQKATELGVNEIIPVVAERSQIRHTRKLTRWKKIAEEASKQSGRTVVPVIHALKNITEIFNSNKLNGIIFYEGGGINLSETIHLIKQKAHVSSEPFYVCIGPEGGFTEQEIESAIDNGLVTVFLGKRVLRAETAALSAITLVQFFLGDLH